MQVTNPASFFTTSAYKPATISLLNLLDIPSSTVSAFKTQAYLSYTTSPTLTFTPYPNPTANMSSTIPLYDATIGVSTHSLETLLDLLKKAQAHPEADTLAATRLYPDMLPFSSQVLIVSNFAKKNVERLTARTLDVWADDETTLEQLVARVEKTLDLLKTVKPEDLDGWSGSDRTTEIKIGPFDPVQATASQYVLGYSLPNLLFHLSIAYGLLRMKGLELGKADYLKHFVSDFFTLPGQ